MSPLRTLASWEENTFSENIWLSAISVGLTLFAGLMSGLTLGLCSIDKTQLEVLKRSGTQKEQKWAAKVAPLLENTHFLLVTLLLCNAGAMEALPLFLDRLANPVMAIILSVTAVLFFGEIIPQSVCSKYGLAIGAQLAWFVRLLMLVCSPVAWPVGKLLDRLLGADHHSMFRRKQLKALVAIHGEDKGLGGKLTRDETKIITGALDLTSKKALTSMTPLEHVFMLSTDDRLDEPTLKSILNSGHSRIPVYRDGDRTDIVGLILVKELLQYKMSEAVPVAMLKMRSLPRLSASTPMYDMLKLFQTGRSHMAVLTRPRLSPDAALCEAQRAEAEARAEEAAARAHIVGGPHMAHMDHSATALSMSEAGEDFNDDGDRSVLSEDGKGPHGPGSSVSGDGGGGGNGGSGHGGAWCEADERRYGYHHHQHHQHAEVQPIGIITIEDVIEELIRSEIVDETDIYIDNTHRVRVNQALLAQTLPERLRSVLSSDLAAVIGAVRAGAAAGGTGGSASAPRTAPEHHLVRISESGELKQPLLLPSSM